VATPTSYFFFHIFAFFSLCMCFFLLCVCFNSSSCCALCLCVCASRQSSNKTKEATTFFDRVLSGNVHSFP
jgi:hypothetical protein